MSKDWKKALGYEIDLTLNAIVYDVSYKGFTVEKIYKKYSPTIAGLLAKQRTQLLARVREEIEKSRKKIPNEFYSFRPKDHMTNEEYEKYQYDEGFNLSVEEQLKKLEIISEEGKGD